MIEQYFSIGQVAERLGISAERTRQMVMDEPGVLKIPAQQKTPGSTRRRMMYRIPESVVERLVRRASNPVGPQREAHA